MKEFTPIPRRDFALLLGTLPASKPEKLELSCGELGYHGQAVKYRVCDIRLDLKLSDNWDLKQVTSSNLLLLLFIVVPLVDIGLQLSPKIIKTNVYWCHCDSLHRPIPIFGDDTQRLPEIDDDDTPQRGSV